MNKFLFSSLIELVYSEIRYITYNIKKEVLDESDIRKLSEQDYINLKKSKQLYKYQEYLQDTDLKNLDYIFDNRFIQILQDKEYNQENMLYLIKYMNPYIKKYIASMKELTDQIASVLDLKEHSMSFEGTFPVYTKVEEKRCVIERAIISTNAQSYLFKETKKFGYKVTYMDYDVPLKGYSFNGINLKEKSREEIFKIMDDSIKVNLNDCMYYETTLIEIDTNSEGLIFLNKGEMSLWLDKKQKTYGGLKDAIKSSLKRTLITLGIIVLVTVIILVLKYVKF